MRQAETHGDPDRRRRAGAEAGLVDERDAVLELVPHAEPLELGSGLVRLQRDETEDALRIATGDGLHRRVTQVADAVVEDDRPGGSEVVFTHAADSAAFSGNVQNRVDV